METALKEGGGASDIKLDEILEANATPPLLLHFRHLKPHPTDYTNGPTSTR